MAAMSGRRGFVSLWAVAIIAVGAIALAWSWCSIGGCNSAPPRTDQPTPTSSTFNDPQGRYSLTYPIELQKEYREDTLVLRLPEISPDAGAPSLFVNVDPNPNGLSAEEFYDGDPGENLFGNSVGPIERIHIPAGTALEFHPKMSLDGATIFVIPETNRFIRIVDDGNTFEESGQIQQVLQGISI